MCRLSDEAESSEMARINISTSICRSRTPRARATVTVQPDPARLLVLGDERDDADDDTGGAGRLRP
jgi:hypothetical protein